LIVAALDRLRASGSTVVAIHHTPHDGRSTPRGSSALLGAVDCVMTLHQAERQLRLACSKQRDGIPFAPIAISLMPVAESVVPALVVDEPTDATPVVDDALEARILTTLSAGPQSGSALAKLLRIDRGVVFECLQRLASAGHIKQMGAGPARRWRRL
jgi:hypothetical protein